MFHLPLSEEAYSQYLQLQDSLDEVQLNENLDRWVYIWGSNLFSSARAYKHLSGTSLAHPIYRWLWKSSCQNKHIIFFWLLIKDRVSTRGLLRRRMMELEDYSCVLCDGQIEETLEHLFLYCPFAAECWSYLNLVITQTEDLMEIIQQLKIQLNQPFFMEVIILQCWAIWMTRNNKIFKDIPPSVQGCKQLFCLELDDLTHRIKRKYSIIFQE